MDAEAKFWRSCKRGKYAAIFLGTWSLGMYLHSMLGEQYWWAVVDAGLALICLQFYLFTRYLPQRFTRQRQELENERWATLNAIYELSQHMTVTSRMKPEKFLYLIIKGDLCPDCSKRDGFSRWGRYTYCGNQTCRSAFTLDEETQTAYRNGTAPVGFYAGETACTT